MYSYIECWILVQGEICYPLKRAKFSVRQMHNVSRRFLSVGALRSALWHEFGDVVPDEGEFNLGYFEGKQHTKKWLVTSQDLEAIYRENHVFIYGEGKEQEESDEERITKKKSRRESRRNDKEESSKMFFNN